MFVYRRVNRIVSPSSESLSGLLRPESQTFLPLMTAKPNLALVAPVKLVAGKSDGNDRPIVDRRMTHDSTKKRFKIFFQQTTTYLSLIRQKNPSVD